MWFLTNNVNPINIRGIVCDDRGINFTNEIHPRLIPHKESSEAGALTEVNNTRHRKSVTRS